MLRGFASRATGATGALARAIGAAALAAVLAGCGSSGDEAPAGDVPDVATPPAEASTDAGDAGAAQDAVAADAPPDLSAGDAEAGKDAVPADVSADSPSDGSKDVSTDGSTDGSKDGSKDAAAEPNYDPQPVDGSTCGAVIQAFPNLDSPHVPECTKLAYNANPPTSGPHFDPWPKWKSYGVPVPRGYLLHANEHGAITFHYNCPGGCAAEVAAAEAFIAALPKDPMCLNPPPYRRFIITPDPLLDVKWAASAWGWHLRASCFDKAAFALFVAMRYGKGHEDFCDEGWYEEGYPKGCDDANPGDATIESACDDATCLPDTSVPK